MSEEENPFSMSNDDDDLDMSERKESVSQNKHHFMFKG